MADQPRRTPRAHDSKTLDQKSSAPHTGQPTETSNSVHDEIARISLPPAPAPNQQSKPTLDDVRTLPLGKPGERLANATASERPRDTSTEQSELEENKVQTPRHDDGYTWHPIEKDIEAFLDAINPRGPLDVAKDLTETFLPKGNAARSAVSAVHEWSEDPIGVAHDVLDFASPAGDIEAMADGSRQISESALTLNPIGIVAGAALLAGGLLSIIIPGSQYLRKGAKWVGKRLNDHIANRLRAGDTPHSRTISEADAKARRQDLSEHVDDLDVRDIATFDADGFSRFGRGHGVDNLGGERTPKFYQYVGGDTFEVPGGVDGTFSYWELLKLRASGIDASRIPEDLHIKIQQKLARTMMPENATDAQVFNNFLFAMVTPNQSLVNSQVIMSVMRIRSPKDMDTLANMIWWKPGEAIDSKTRRRVSRDIAAHYGLQSKARGGLGVAGTIDYTRLAEFAQRFQKHPELFRKRPTENWIQFNDRVATAVDGLGTKSTALGIGIQDPLNAAMGQVDRILARTEFKTLFKTDAAERVFEQDVVTLWNQKVGPKSSRAVESLDELVTLKGGESFLDRRIARLLAAVKTPRFIEGPNGPIPNPKIPAHLNHPDDPITSDYVNTMSPAYNSVLVARLKKAEKTELSGFSFSWMSWDRARGSLEPHEHWFPGLEKLPQPTREQYELFLETQREAGRLNFSRRPEDAHLGRRGRQNPPKPYAKPAAGALLSLPPALVFSIGAAHEGRGNKQSEAKSEPQT